MKLLNFRDVYDVDSQ